MSKIFSRSHPILGFSKVPSFSKPLDPKVKNAIRKMNEASMDCSKSDSHAGFKPVQHSAATSEHSEAWKARSRGSATSIDPFALKISIPPLVLLAYVIWKSSFKEDWRLRYIREAEEKHITYMASEEAERTTLESLSTISVRKI